MEPTAPDELGLPLIAGGETRMEEEDPVHQYHQRTGGRRGGVHDGFLVTAVAAATVELDLLLVDLLRAGLLSMLLYMQFSISFLAGAVPNNNNNDDNETAAAAAAGTTTNLMMMMKLWWSSRTTISWSLVHFCTTSILYRRTIRHASTITTTTTIKTNRDHSPGSWRSRWTTTTKMLLSPPLVPLVWLWLPELIAVSTIALCAVGHNVEIAMVLFLVGKYVMATFAVVYWMARSLIFFLFLWSSSSCGRSRRLLQQCPNKPDEDDDEAAADDDDDDETSTTDGNDVRSSNCVYNRV